MRVRRRRLFASLNQNLPSSHDIVEPASSRRDELNRGRWAPATEGQGNSSMQTVERGIKARAWDLLAAPVAVLFSLTGRLIRRVGVDRLPITLGILRRFGVFPIRDHYYEPLFNPAHLRKPLSEDRELPAIDWNVAEQLSVMQNFQFNHELKTFAVDGQNNRQFYYNNAMFGSGDAEYLYNVIRFFKPRRLIEIGSGQSTLLAMHAIEENRRNDPASVCEHICIEPYEAAWLDELAVKVIREPVEIIDKELFENLKVNDILFIDSSHMIRAQGDVLFEYLEILPILNSGVLVHIHDIFSPRDYPDEWISQQVRFWNEQYLLEAFLSFNSAFKIVGALNFLKHHHPHELARCCPILSEQMDYREPGSFWMRRV
jgi:hypothetical protein